MSDQSAAAPASGLADVKFGTEVEALLKSYSGVSVADIDSILIVSQILKLQLHRTIAKCIRLCDIRKSNCIQLEDVLFIVSKDEMKFPRLVKHLIFKDKQGKLKATSNLSAGDSIENFKTEFGTGGSAEASNATSNVNRVNSIKKFLDTFEVSKEVKTCCFTTQLDSVKRLRLQREERLSCMMSPSQYVQWNQTKVPIHAQFRSKIKLMCEKM